MHRLATRFEHYSPRGVDASLDLNNIGRQFYGAYVTDRYGRSFTIVSKIVR